MAQEFTFTVNGVERTTTQNKPLLRYLRDDLHIHSAKDGCSEGACGTCTIHVDGAAVKACVKTHPRPHKISQKTVGRFLFEKKNT